jgi:hypothetical protein
MNFEKLLKMSLKISIEKNIKNNLSQFAKLMT